MKKFLLPSLILVILISIVTATAVAAPVSHITLDPSHWVVNSEYGWDVYTGNYTVESVVGGNLRITRTIAQGGTGYSAHLKTDASYNYQNAVLRFSWKVNGQGSYCHVSGGPNAFMFWGPTGRLSTHHSYDGSVLVQNDTWMYTQVTLNDDWTWLSTTGYNDYGLSDISTFSGTLSQSNFEKLGDTFFRLSLCDNYAAGAYIEVSEAYIVSQVPIPGGLILLGTGLLGIIRIRNRRRCAIGR